MQVYLDTMKTQQKLYGYPTEDLEQLSKQLDQATDLQEFLKAIKPRTDPTALGTILLVQGGDDPERSMNARGLRSHGYNVIEASGGIEAMVTLKDGAVDLVVSNVHSEFRGVRVSDGTATACRTILDGPALLKGFRRFNPNLIRRDLQRWAFLIGRYDPDLIEDLEHKRVPHPAHLARSSIKVWLRLCRVASHGRRSGRACRGHWVPCSSSRSRQWT